MASYRAVSAASHAIIALLRASFNRNDFGRDLEFDVYSHQSFRSAMSAGVSLFVYRIFHNGTNRMPAGRRHLDGRRDPPRLPIDFHFILTAWASTPSLEHTIAGWFMRTLEDHLVLPAGFLNVAEPDTFRPDEMLEIAPAELATEDLLRLWEGLLPNGYRLSVPYAARTLLIDSNYDAQTARAVDERLFEYRRITAETGS